MHELAHIKRGDLWVNLAQTALQIIYFYNPLLWLANCVIRRIREQAVDEAVLVAMGAKARQYPQTLVDVAKLAFKRPALSLRLIGVVESESALAGRIKHILGRPMPKSAKVGILGLLAVIIAGAVLLPMARASRGVVLTVAPDGSAQYNSIQKAIDAASAGAVVRIAPGVYKERIKIDKPLTLEGAGWDQTTIVTENKAAEVFEEALRIAGKRMLEAESEEHAKKLSAELEAEFEAEMKEKLAAQTHLVSDTENIVIRNLKLTSPGRRVEGRALSVPVIKFSNARALVSGCAVVGTPGDGIHIVKGSDVEIRDSLVAGVWSTGIAVAPGKGGIAKARILNCDVRNCYHRGITIGRGCDSTVVRGCRISGSSWHGIRYDNASPRIVDNLIFANVRCGIYASGKTSATIKQNLFYGNEMAGIGCWFQNRDTIEGNTFVGNKRSGLEVLGASRPIVRKNIFYANPTGVFCGNIGGDSTSAGSEGTVDLEENLFWGFEHKVAWRHPGDAEDEVVTEDVPLDKKSRNVAFDPEFKDITREDFSLRVDSPARRGRIGAADLIASESPWPLQEEELAIIPESDTRDYQQWKHQGESTPMAKAEKDDAVQAASLDHFVGKYAIAKHPDKAAFEITKESDVFIFSDLGGPKFEMELLLRGLEGRKFEMEKGRDNLKFGDNRRDRFRMRYDASEDRYILDRLGMRGEVQDGMVSPLTELVKISAEKPENIFAARLPNGVTVELVGVCEHPSEGKQWWGLDGQPIEKPYERLNYPERSGESKLYEVVYRLFGSEDIRSEIYSNSTITGHISFYPLSKKAENLNIRDDANAYGAILLVKPDAQSIRLEIGAGRDCDWKTLCTQPNPVDKSGTTGPGVVFQPAIEKDGKTYVTIAHQVKDGQIHLIAVDHSGQIHKSEGFLNTTSNELGSCQVRFNLPADQIKEIQFQTQKFQRVTFKNVPLRPGHKTDVQVEGEEAAEVSAESEVVTVPIVHDVQNKATLPNGVTVELIGLCEEPVGGAKWWKPDGSYMPEPFFKANKRTPPLKGMTTQYTFLAKAEGSEDTSIKMKIYEGFGWSTQVAEDGTALCYIKHRNDAKPYYEDAFSQGPIEVGVAQGQWIKGRGVSSPNIQIPRSYSIGNHDEIVIQPPQPEKNSPETATIFWFTSSSHDYEYRLICTLKDGSVEECMKPFFQSANIIETGNLKNSTLNTKSFNIDRPLEQIVNYELLYRKFDYARFNNVVFKPNAKTNVQVGIKSDSTVQAVPLKAFEFKLVEKLLDLVKQVEKEYPKQATHWPAGAGLYHIDAQGQVTVWHYRSLWRRSTDCAPDEVGWGSSQLVNAVGMYYLPDGTPLQSRWRERGGGMKDIRIKVGREVGENEHVPVIHRHRLPDSHDLLSRDGLERNILLDSWKDLPLAIIVR
ncbi:MAG TPA: NosD domain-containing protein, partial [Sedimentisphaerales bacterium]|nr:NosD domain-containing protein [Sedimentisphaerales bacterium]